MKSLLLLLTIMLSPCFVSAQPSALKGINDLWTTVLQKYVHDGRVDYRGLKSDSDFETLLPKFNNITITGLTKEEKLALYINAYNAGVIKIICDNYPVDNIQKLKVNGETAFKIKFFNLSKKMYSLDDIENLLIRGLYTEPRIHFALVAGAVSSPELANTAYSADKLNDMLNNQAQLFLTNTRLNKLDFVNLKLELNEVFKWYANDFGGTENFQNYISPFVKPGESSILKKGTFTITYLPYDWSINDKKKQNLYK